MPTVSADDIVGYAPGTRGRTVSPDDILGLADIPTYAPQTVTDADIVPTPQELSTLEAPEGSPQREDINRGVAGNLFAPPGAFARDPTLAELINASMPRGVQEEQRQEQQIPMAPPLPEQGAFEQGGILGVTMPAVEAGGELAGAMIPHDLQSYLAQFYPPAAAYQVGKHLAQGDVSDIPLVGRIPEIMSAEDTPAFSKERYLTAGKTLMDLGILGGAAAEHAPTPLRAEPTLAERITQPRAAEWVRDTLSPETQDLFDQKLSQAQGAPEEPLAPLTPETPPAPEAAPPPPGAVVPEAAPPELSPAERNAQILERRKGILARKAELTARAANGEQGLETHLAAVDAELMGPGNPVVHPPPAVETPAPPPPGAGFAKATGGKPPLAPVPSDMINAVKLPSGKIVGHNIEHGDVLSRYSEQYEPGEMTSGWVLKRPTRAETDATFIGTDDVQRHAGDFDAAFKEKAPPPDYTPEAAAARAAQPVAPPVQTGLPESGFSTERAQKNYGEDAVLITKGKSPKAWKAIGQADKRNPYDVLEKARARKIATPDEAANLRAEHQRLLERARQQYGTPEYNDLAQNAVDFLNASKEVVHGPASDVMRGLQEADTPTYMSPADYDNILRERQMQPTADETATFEKVTNEMKNGDKQAREAAGNGQEAVRKYRPKEVIPFDEAADYVKKQIKDLTEPCAL